MTGEAEYLFRAAEMEKTHQLKILESGWRDVRDALENHETYDSSLYERADQIYESFDGEMKLDNFRRVLSLLDWVQVVEAMNPETQSRNQYRMDSYDPGLMEDMGRMLEENNVKDVRPEYRKMAAALRNSDSIKEAVK